MMNKVYLFSLLLFASCGHIAEVASIPEAENKTANYKYYDAESKVRYKVANDDENIHLTLNTADPASIYKILNFGLKIYLDDGGKKSKNTYIQYPLIDEDEQFKDHEYQGPINTQIDIKRTIRELNSQALFVRGKEIESFTPLSGSIKFFLSAPSPQELTYEVYIPLNKLFQENTADKTAVSFGVVSGAAENKLSVTGNNSASQNMPNSNIPGESGMPNASARIGTSSPNSPLNESIDFWFKAILK